MRYSYFLQLAFLQLAFFTLLTLCAVSVEERVSDKSNGTTIPVPKSKDELKRAKAECKKIKETLQQLEFQQHDGSSNGPDRRQDYPEHCVNVDNFSLGQTTAEEALNWINSANGDAEAIYQIADRRTGVSNQVLKTLMYNITKHRMDSVNLPLISALGGSFAKRLGGFARITVQDVQFLGSALVYSLPKNAYLKVSDAVFELIMSHLFNETSKALKMLKTEQGMQDREVNGSTVSPDQLAPQVDYAATNMNLQMDMPRMKAICLRAFNSVSKNMAVSLMTTRVVLLMCAPPSVCKRIDNNVVQNNLEVISHSPWSCSKNSEDSRQFDKLFPTNPVCGKYIAMKAVSGGNNPVPLDSKEDVMRLGRLALCLDDEYLMTAVDAVGCEMAMEGLQEGIFPKKIKKYVIGKCVIVPTDLSSLNCSTIASQYGPALAYMKANFYKSLDTAVLCDPICMETFTQVKNLPDIVKTYMMNKCFSTKDLVIDSNTLQQMGAMVTELPIEKFSEISANDLKNNLNAIKESMKSSTKLQKKKKKSIMKQIAKKMRQSGSIRDVTDSPDIMKEISLKDLKASVTDIEADLGLDDPQKTVALTESQNRWVMKQIMKEKKASNFSAEDIRSKKSVVKGFSSKDIKSMANSQSSMNESGGLDLAKAMCEQTNWPLKALKSINRDLIVGALKARNNTHAMSTLTQVDVTAIGCECLMHFTAQKLKAMSPDVCSAVCEKIGYCNNFRCLNPRQRTNALQACMACKGLGDRTMSKEDIDELGPNLISQLSPSQLTSLVPSTVLMTKLQELKDMCMDQSFRKAVANKLSNHIGSSGSNFDADTIQLLGSGIMLFSRTVQQQFNKTVISDLAQKMVGEILPTEETYIRLKKCCQRWLDDTDLADLKELKRN